MDKKDEITVVEIGAVATNTASIAAGRFLIAFPCFAQRMMLDDHDMKWSVLIKKRFFHINSFIGQVALERCAALAARGGIAHDDWRRMLRAPFPIMIGGVEGL